LVSHYFVKYSVDGTPGISISYRSPKNNFSIYKRIYSESKPG